MAIRITDCKDIAHISNLSELLGTYRFKLGEFDTLISVRLWQRIGDSRVYYEQSHHIKTPPQAQPYHTSCSDCDNEGEALYHAITGFTQFYEIALKDGHKPEEKWLIPNTHF